MAMMTTQALAADLWPFDKAPWGMSLQEAVAMFKLQSPPQEGQLMLNASVGIGKETRPALIGLYFSKDQVHSVITSIGMPDGNAMTRDSASETYKRIQNALDAEYMLAQG